MCIPKPQCSLYILGISHYAHVYCGDESGYHVVSKECKLSQRSVANDKDVVQRLVRIV